MIWQNGWAWAGLATLALPVLIHLLSRGRTRVERFPTLRFVPASRLLPSKRTRLHDLLLLAIRLGILVAAVAALARPLLRTIGRRRLLDATLARAIVVDTSASMSRATPSGGSALVAARREAQRLADSSQAHIVLETAAPARALDGAAVWLQGQEGRGEVVVISDFQSGTLDATDLARIPPGDGIRLTQIRTDPTDSSFEIRSRLGHGEMLARTTTRPGHSEVEWSHVAGASPDARSGVTILAAPAELAGITAAQAAASTVSVPLPADTMHSVAIVFPAYPARATLQQASGPLQAAWMSDVVLRVRSDSLLRAAAAGSHQLPIADSGSGLVLVRDASGRALVVAAQGSVEGTTRLLLLPLVDPASLVSAALIAATNRAMSGAAPVEELDPSRISDSLLASWQRTPAAEGHPAPQADSDTGTSDGRWFWVLALVLLLIETWFRNRTKDAATAAPARNAIA